MEYGIRFSFDINKDIARNWSAYMAYQDPTAFGVLSQIEPQVTRRVARECGAPTDETFLSVDELLAYADEDTIVDAYFDQYDIRWHDGANAYMLFHHNGLACFRLNAETEAEALAEFEKRAFNTHSFVEGYATHGAVRVLKTIEMPSGWHAHLLEADEIWHEPL